MGAYTGVPEYPESIYQFEVTDVVEGGPDGKDNQPLKELANRTEWLKSALRGFIGFTFSSSTATLSKSDILQKLVVVDANFASLELTLPGLNSTTDVGTVVSVFAYNVFKIEAGVVQCRQVSIKSNSVNILTGSGSKRQRLYMGDGDKVQLIWTGSDYILLDSIGNFSDVGSPVYHYAVVPNTVIAQGQLLLRSEYPRLWEFAQTLGPVLIPDLTWQGSSNNKGFFSTGNGTTTFRVPDLRAMFIRGLDLGAGIDFGRTNPNAGGYESDAIIEHYHKVNLNPNANSQGGYGKITTGNDGPEGSLPIYKSQGAINAGDASVAASETRPKNIGLIPLIKV